VNLDLVITQLRAYCPALLAVAGVADFDTGMKTVVAISDPGTGALIYPVAVVMPLDDEADPNDTLAGLSQVVTETIGVIVEFDASADRRGQGGVSQVETMKYALFRALLNWQVDGTRAARGLYYGGGELLEFDRARLFWQFRFSHDATITEADGFQNYGPPLASILSTVPVADPTAQGIVFDTRIR